MKKNIISEVSRVREIMGLPLISEQEHYDIGKVVVRGDVDKGEPIQIIVDKVAKYAVLDDAAESVAEPFIADVVDKLKEKFDGDLQKAIDAGMTLTKAIIRSGASNYYKNGSTVANVENDRFTPITEKQDVKWNEKSTPYKNNAALAKSRGTNFLAYIKAALKKKGINNLDSLESEDIQSVIVDTGGVIDENRVEKDYPNPGQFLTMDLQFDKAPGGGGLTECLVDMSILVGYYRTGHDYSDGLTSGQDHMCDSAIFDVYLNKIYVFTANLNNNHDPGGTGPHGGQPYQQKIKDSKKYRVINPDKPGSNVACGVTINNALAQQIMKDTNDKTIEVGIEGQVEGGKSPGEKSSGGHQFGGPNAVRDTTYQGEYLYVCGRPGYHAQPCPTDQQLNLHAQVPMVTLMWGDGEQKVSEPNVTLTRGENVYKKIMTFDVCKREIEGEGTG